MKNLWPLELGHPKRHGSILVGLKGLCTFEYFWYALINCMSLNKSMITWNSSTKNHRFLLLFRLRPRLLQRSNHNKDLCASSGLDRLCPWRVNGWGVSNGLVMPSGTPGSSAVFFVWRCFFKGLDYQFASSWNLFLASVYCTTASRLEDEYTFRRDYCKSFVVAQVIILHHRCECYIMLHMSGYYI